MNSINIAPGVKLYEGNTYKSGPSLYVRLTEKYIKFLKNINYSLNYKLFIN